MRKETRKDLALLIIRHRFGNRHDIRVSGLLGLWLGSQYLISDSYLSPCLAVRGNSLLMTARFCDQTLMDNHACFSDGRLGFSSRLICFFSAIVSGFAGLYVGARGFSSPAKRR